MSTDKAQPDARSEEIGSADGAASSDGVAATGDAGTRDGAATTHGPATTTAVASADPVDPQARSTGAAGDSCPSCDAPGAWTLSSRHRFNPFGGVTCLVLAFWAGLLGWLLGFGFLPAGGLFLLGVTLIAARRTALVCQVCGFVKPRD